MATGIDRRTALTAGAVLAAALAGSGRASAQQVAAPAPEWPPKPQPLPYPAGSIAGLSDKLLTSHHANNYVGAVNRIGAINAELAKLDVATAPGFQVNGLKREQLLAMNSMILHEAYFSSMGVERRAPDDRLGGQIEADFGSLDKWRAEFTAMGKALGGGSGWVLLTWSPRMGRLVNQWAFDHTMTLADGKVLLALDMYEHAYHIDFGAKAAAYVDVCMEALDWARANGVFAAGAAQ